MKESYLHFDVTNSEMSAGDVYIAKEIQTVMDRNGNCKVYDSNETFSLCAKASMKKEITNIVNCTVAPFISVMPQDLPYCSEEEAKVVMSQVQDLIWKHAQYPGLYGCPKSCDEVVYKSRVTNFHKFVFGTKTSDTYGLIIMFESDIVEVKSEVQRYTFTGVIAEIGGSMGLFLGLSCYTMISDVISLINRIVQKKSNVKQLPNWAD